MSESSNNVQRMNWLDGARLAAAFCIIAIHSSSDQYGEAFKAEAQADRVFPITFRALAEVASTEFFILVSLFLLSLSLAKQTHSYGKTMLTQARRLLIPFLVWTLFYAFFRLYKAYMFDYSDAMWHELTQIKSWIGYLVLGMSHYHMHFLPTLFLLLLFHRLYKLAIVYPLLGWIVVPMVYINISIGNWLWPTVEDKVMIEYYVRFVKILTYTGYGFFAYSLYGVWKRGIDKQLSNAIFGLTLLLLFIGVLVKLIYAHKVGVAGEFIVRRDLIYYGHYLFPCIMLFAFMSTQYFKWPEKLSLWSKFSFGMYLIHPAILDIIEIVLTDVSVNPTQYVLIKYAFTAFFSLFISILISRLKPIAWIIGLGPLPFTGKQQQNSEPKLKYKAA